jgi:hypothetical protein
MLTLHLSEIYQRGLRSFQELSSLERDVFSVHDANLRFEMEGTLSTFVGSSASAAVATWLNKTLTTIGDKESQSLLVSIAAGHGVDSANLEDLSSRFYARLEERWALVDRYLEANGAKVVS